MKYKRDYDYHNFDRLSVTLKLDKEPEMVERFGCFGWRQVERFDDRQYDDLVHIAFERPHKIDNKDELQLLQVNMESCVNKSAKLKKNKLAKTTIIGLIAGMIGCGMIAGGIVIAVLLHSILTIALGSVLAAAGLAEILICLPFLLKTAKKEQENFTIQYAQTVEETDKICNAAKALTGGSNE